MISSPNNGGFAQQLEAMRQRLMSLRDRVETQLQFDRAFQREIIEALQAVLSFLQIPEVANAEQLRSSLQQQTTLWREAHHRVKNHLQIVSSLLDLQMMQSSDPGLQTLLRENQSRIRSIALVHELLSESGASLINLGTHVRTLAETLVSTYAIAANQVTLRTEISAQPLVSPDLAIPIGLILNELVSNALKHGLANQQGEIAIALNSAPNQQVILSVSDTGNRFPAEFDPREARSLGYQLINTLVQQIEGTLTIDRTHLTTIQVSFPIR